jgi:hypothetical protein
MLRANQNSKKSKDELKSYIYSRHRFCLVNSYLRLIIRAVLEEIFCLKYVLNSNKYLVIFDQEPFLTFQLIYFTITFSKSEKKYI